MLSQRIRTALALVSLSSAACNFGALLPKLSGEDSTYSDASRALGESCVEDQDCRGGAECNASSDICEEASSPSEATDAGSAPKTGTAVTVNPTTTTAAIPAAATNCSGSTYGDNGDLAAINTPVFVSGTNVTSLTLRFDMGYYFGEPTRKAVISWQGTGSISSLLWLAEVQDSQGKQYVNSSGKRVYASYNLGSIKGPGEGFGIDSTGSPSWAQTFVTYDNSSGTAFGVTETEAKNIYKACFSLANVRLVKINGTAALK